MGICVFPIGTTLQLFKCNWKICSIVLSLVHFNHIAVHFVMTSACLTHTFVLFNTCLLFKIFTSNVLGDHMIIIFKSPNWQIAKLDITFFMSYVHSLYFLDYNVKIYVIWFQLKTNFLFVHTVLIRKIFSSIYVFLLVVIKVKILPQRQESHTGQHYVLQITSLPSKRKWQNFIMKSHLTR